MNKLIENFGVNCTCFIQGAPGENGTPGRSIDEDEIRDICYNILRNQLEELTANLQGPPGKTKIKYSLRVLHFWIQGPPGVGKRGLQGPPGSPGALGERGRAGFQGIQGLPGLGGKEINDVADNFKLVHLNTKDPKVNQVTKVNKVKRVTKVIKEK